MTKEARIVFSLNDLLSVRFQCGKCQGEVVQKFGGRHLRLPLACPLCFDPWDERDGRRQELDELLLMMRNLSDRPDPKISLRFELDSVEAEEGRRT